MHNFNLPLGLIELLTRVGEPHVRVQWLVASLTNVKTRPRGDTLLTFGTNQITALDLARGNPAMTGVVLWIPTARLQHALCPPEIIQQLAEESTDETDPAHARAAAVPAGGPAADSDAVRTVAIPVTGAGPRGVGGG